MVRLRHIAIVLISALAVGSEAHAQDTLDLSVKLSDGTQRVYSLEDLDRLENVQFDTNTIWTDGVITFSGVPLLALLDDAGASGNTLVLSALNEYSVEMPIAELEGDAPIVATRLDGQTISVRDKGPFWVIYPFDSNPSYKTETNYSRSVWQLTRLIVSE